MTRATSRGALPRPRRRPRGAARPRSRGRHPLPSPAAFAATLARVGIGPDDQVVAYDDVGGWVAARLWWMLDDLGHRGGVAVLDGGLQAWVAAGGELSDEPAPATDAPLDPDDSGWPTTGRRRSIARACATAGRGRAARRPRSPTLPGRDRADRRLPGPHPDVRQCPDRRQPRRAERPVPAAVRAPCPVRRAARGGGLGRRRGGGRAGRHVVRQRRLGRPQRAGHAPRRPGRPDPLRRLVQRLVPGRGARDARTGAGSSRSTALRRRAVR